MLGAGMRGELSAPGRPDQLRALLYGLSAPSQPTAQVQAARVPAFLPPYRELRRLVRLLRALAREALRAEARGPRGGGGRARGHPRRTVLAWVVSGAGTTQISRSDGIVCRGCNRSIRMGTPMEVCDEGFVHPEEDCRARARARRAPATGGRHSVTPTATAMATDLQKQARVSAQLSDRRMSTVRGCMDGRCSLRDDATAAKMVCRGGCGRTLHQRCADISKGYLLKGALTCVWNAACGRWVPRGSRPRAC